MKAFSKNLITETEQRLKEIHLQTEKPLEYSEKAIESLTASFESLKVFCISHKFEKDHDEIFFFKNIKPQLVSKLIYYNEIYNIEMGMPVGGEKRIHRYYTAEIKKLEAFFKSNADFYKYYRTGSNFLDQKYFMRGKKDIRLTIESSSFEADNQFSTSHDFKVAKLIANEVLRDYLLSKVAPIKSQQVNSLPAKRNLKWTGSNVALVELLYALQTEGAFNNGNASLSEIATVFSSYFDIDLGQYRRTFLEIRSRKTARSRFLASLADKLLDRMDSADEN